MEKRPDQREYDGAQIRHARPLLAGTENGRHSATTGQSLDTFTMLRYLPRALPRDSARSEIPKRGYIFQLIDTGVIPVRRYRTAIIGLIDYDGNFMAGFYVVRNMMHILCDDWLCRRRAPLSHSLSERLSGIIWLCDRAF